MGDGQVKSSGSTGATRVKPRIVDSHVHVFPDRLQKIARKLAPTRADEITTTMSMLRSQGRMLLQPVSRTFHTLQPMTRFLPKPARDALDSLGAMAMIPGMLVESTPMDLGAALDGSDIDFALVIAHPPAAQNEFVLELTQEDDRFLPVVNIPRNSPRPAALLKKFVKQGARALKLHPAADGEGVDSFRYRRLLQTADELGLPVIIHTGCLHIRPFYRDPKQGDVKRFLKWFGMYPNIRFILAHMNFHCPGDAMDIAEEHSNVFLETSWQPSETVAEAVSRVGAERVMFGSDWPLLGANISVGIDRIRECREHGLLKPDQLDLILGENAARVFGIS